MKQIAFISGKGGTGKTVISGALSAIPKQQVISDCDVDAANLHLLLRPVIQEKNGFTGGSVAVIDADACISCNICRDECRYDAITSDFTVNDLRCEGCGLCVHLCPTDAIRMESKQAGEWFLSATRYGTFVHAKLFTGEENSGKLASHIKHVAKNIGKEKQVDFVIIDGPPGIGCPLIATIAGIDLAVIITEPTLSAIHDLERITEVTTHFKVPTAIVINKASLNTENTGYIRIFGKKHGIPVIGELPFSGDVDASVAAGIPLTEYSGNSVKSEIMEIWERLKALLQ